MQNDFSKFNRIAVIVLALISIIVCVELLVVYYNSNFNPNAAASFCSISEHIDCDGVAKTVYSRLFGVPLALWGLGFYSFILGLAVFPFKKFKLFEDFNHPKSYIFVLSIFAMILSFLLYYISHFVIDKICVLCQSLYVTNSFLLLVSKLGTPAEDLIKNSFNDAKKIFSNKNWQVIATVSVFLGVSVLIAINIYKPFLPKVQINSGIMVHNVKHQRHNKPIGNILGSKEAKLVIHEYTDYQCPFCEKSNQMLLQLAQEVDNIRVEHHDFPLDSECNPYINRKMHPYACMASYYAKAARMQGKFWDLSVLLHMHRQELNERKILELAESVGLDIEKLKKDVSENKADFKEEIVEDINTAQSMGIYGTPTVVIGIKKYEGAKPYEELKQRVLDNL